jgi:phosphomannomutase/phosphoglucomutase
LFLEASGKSFSEVLADIPVYYTTPDIRIRYTGEKEKLVRAAVARAESQRAHLVMVDGVKAEYEKGWALMRTSVTEPALTFRFEGETREDMLSVAQRFLEGLGEVSGKVWEQVVE